MCLCFPLGDEIGWVPFFNSVSLHFAMLARVVLLPETEAPLLPSKGKWWAALSGRGDSSPNRFLVQMQLGVDLKFSKTFCLLILSVFTLPTVFMCVWFMHVYVPHVLCTWPRSACLHAGQRLTLECLPQSFSTFTLTLFGDWVCHWAGACPFS